MKTFSVDQLDYLDRESLITVLEAFVQQLQNLPAEILAAIEAAQLDSIKKLAHKFKGSCRSMAADALGDICFALEKAAEKGDQAALQQRKLDLERMAKETLAEANQKLKEVQGT